MNVLSDLGSVASIGGAIISVLSAIVANRIKNSMIDKLHSSDISELKARAKIASEQVNKICQPQNKLRGVNTTEIAVSLRQVHSLINENKDILSKYNFSKLESTIDDYNNSISDLLHENDKSKYNSIGQKLRELIDHIVSELSRISRLKLES